MAYVRRTQTLVDDVAHNIENMRNDEVYKLHKRASVEMGTPLYDDVRKAVEASIWSEAPDLFDKLPKAWCRFEDSMSVTFRGDARSELIQETLEFPTDDKIKLPPSFSRWDTVRVTSKQFTPLIEQWVSDRYEQEFKRQETVDLFGNIKQQLKDFLMSHASLNAAVKEMPELELYVPQEYLDKLAEKTVRVKKEKTTASDLNIDVDALTQAAIAHRMTSGS